MIDSHVHIVAPDTAAYPRQAASGTAARHASNTVSAAEMLDLMTAGGLDRVVLVQSFAAYAFDNRYIVDEAKRHPDHFSLVCGVDPTAADAREQAQHWVASGARGLRVLAFAPDFDVACLRSLFGVAQRSEIALCLLATPQILGSLAALLDEFPDVPLVVDHCALLPLDAARVDLGAESLCKLAAWPNVQLKISTRVFAHVVGEPRLAVERMVERFGAGRMMWGSDFPASPAPSYPEMLEMAKQVTSGLGAVEREQILHGTSERIWQLGRKD
jgi:L-fuconolactonase